MAGRPDILHRVALLALGIVLALPGLVLGQRAVSSDTRIDPYGNARGLGTSEIENRSRNMPFSRLSTGSQGLSLSGGLSSSVLDRSPFPIGMAQLPTGMPSQFRLGTIVGGADMATRPGSLLLPTQGFWSEYGGFGEHRAARQQTPMQGLLRRRRSMMAATALNAPVRRSAGATGDSWRSSWVPPRSVPLPAQEDLGTQIVDSRPLSDQMRDQSQAMYFRAKEEAWSRFRAQSYVRAAGLFDAALSVAPMDAGCRIGEVFCYIANGSYRTAFAAMESFARREINPFLYELDIRRMIGDPAEADAVQSQVRARAQRSSEPHAQAAYAFVLWYYGDRESAKNQATVLSSLDSEFSIWREWMDQAEIALDSVE